MVCECTQSISYMDVEARPAESRPRQDVTCSEPRMLQVEVRFCLECVGEQQNLRLTEELAGQIDAIRADIQSLTSTVSRMANKQINRAQDKAAETASQAEEAIRQNPLSAVAIAIGLGFLFGVFTRR